MQSLNILLEAIKNSRIEPDNLTSNKFRTSFDIEAENGWAVNGHVDGYEEFNRDRTDDGLGYVDEASVIVTAVRFAVYDEESNPTMVSEEHYNKIYDAIRGIVG